MEISQEEKRYIVYKHTSPSGKCYIGITNNYKRRTYQHKTDIVNRPFSKAIIKYGWDNIIHEILEENLTLREANIKEKYYIQEFNSLTPNGYNLTTGGEGYILAEEVKEKLRGVYRGSNTGYANITKTLHNKYVVVSSINKKNLGSYNNIEDALEARELGYKTNKANNRQISKTNQVGIMLNKNSYIAYDYINGKRIYFGSYSNLNDAVEARNLREKTTKINVRKSKKYPNLENGISIKNGKYIVRIIKDNKRINIGTYNNLEDAIEAKNLGYKTNKSTKKKNISGVRCVRKYKNKYIVKIYKDDKEVYLGSYLNMEDAIEARDLGYRTVKASNTKRLS